MPDKVMAGVRDSRRSFLEMSAGTIGAAIGLPNVVVADDRRSASEFTYGERQVIDTKVTYPDADDQIQRTRCCVTVPDTLLSETGLFAVRLPVTNLRGAGPLLRTPSGCSGFDGSTTYEAEAAFRSATCDGIIDSVLQSEEPIEPVNVNLQLSGRQVRVTTEDGRTISISPSETYELTLEPRQIHVPTYGEPKEWTAERRGRTVTRMTRPQTGTRTISATPMLSVRNNDPVTIYGAKDGTVLPTSETDAVRDLVGRGKTTLYRVEGADVIVFDRDYTNGGADQ